LLGSSTHPLVFDKQAAPSVPDLVPSRVAINANWGKPRNQLLAALAATALTSTAIGGGITGVIGLLKLRKMQQEAENKPDALPGNIPIHMPIGRMPDREKTAAMPVDVPFGHWRHLVGQAAKGVADNPLAWLALPATAVGTTLGASHLTNKYLHGKMKKMRQEHLDQAQQEFDQEMMDRYNPPELQNEKISAALDRLYALAEKQAFDTGGAAIGAMALPAAASGILGLRSGYNWMEDRKPENLLREALARRAFMRAQAMPEAVQLSLMPPPPRREHKEEKKEDE
jgi:hypothetical protein